MTRRPLCYNKWMLYICVCAVSSAEGGLWGDWGTEIAKRGTEIAKRGTEMGWPDGRARGGAREASKAVTAVAIEVVVVARCPTSEQAREDAAEADGAVK